MAEVNPIRKLTRGVIPKGGPDLLRYSSLGLEMGVAIVIGLLVGLYLDGLLKTKPWLTVVFTLLGVAAGFKNVFKLMAEISDQNRDKPDDRP